MKKTIALLLVVSLPAIGCGRWRQHSLRRDQQKYEVVEEGSANGVTSTISAPGDTTPPPSLTGTNADTTTAFTLPATTATTSTEPGTLAGTLPPGDVSLGYPAPPPRHAPRPNPPPETTQPIPAEETQVEPEPAGDVTATAPRTDTTTTAPPEPPPATDTTTSEPPPDQKPPEKPQLL